LMAHPSQPAPQGVVSPWAFVASAGRRPVSFHEARLALQTLALRPAHQVIKPVQPRARWAVYFIYLPQGGALTASHRFTLARLRALDRGLLVVCACPDVASVPPDLAGQCDALYWKALSGYDFSAYKLALQALAQHASGADVFVMNDSVYGPLTDIAPLIDQAPWDLTGLTASSQIENHIQSYAFVLKGVTHRRLRSLWSVLLPCVAFSRPFDVIEYQETRFAKVAARHMSVGAYWYADAQVMQDPTLVQPLAMLEAGLPFLKKSLLGKHASLAKAEDIRAALQRYGHPA
jgi:lipopolysaccharide biosynthesis protein